MSYNHNLVKIEKEDLFLLLRIRYKKNYKDIQLEGMCDQSPLFLETIEMIQNYDAWLSTLKFGKIATWVMCAELAGDFHLGDSRQLTDKSLLPFDLVS